MQCRRRRHQQQDDERPVGRDGDNRLMQPAPSTATMRHRVHWQIALCLEPRHQRRDAILILLMPQRPAPKQKAAPMAHGSVSSDMNVAICLHATGSSATLPRGFDRRCNGSTVTCQLPFRKITIITPPGTLVVLSVVSVNRVSTFSPHLVLLLVLVLLLTNNSSRPPK